MISSYSYTNEELRYKFKDLIDVKGVPTKAIPDINYEINPFCDMGAWHAYHIPALKDIDYYGGFTGPLCIIEEYGIWLSKCFNKIRIYDSRTGKEFKLSKCNPLLAYFPGILVQKYDMDIFELTLELRFVTNRTALTTTRITNKGNNELLLKLTWSGELFNDIEAELLSSARGIKVNYINIEMPWKSHTSAEMKKEIEYEIRYPVEISTEIKDKGYVASINDIALKPNSQYVINIANTYTLSKQEKYEENIKIDSILNNPDKYIEENSIRWNKYLTSSLKGKNRNYDIAIVKAIETMVTNWRSPAGAITRNGIVPSTSYLWFNGMWAWDSWKHAVAAVLFEPELAKDNIRVMFDYQTEDGMIIDAVFYNYRGDNWNERNSKPPLASWAVWKVYEITKDKEFLKEMYPKLVKYHYWWYKYRDNDKNKIIEYGASLDPMNKSEKDIIQAAAWESGMDNAIRFDKDYGVEVVKNFDEDGNLLGYSINQESVDLNAYLYADKIYLANIAEILDKDDESLKFQKEADFLRDFIQNNMFDEKEGFYFDIDIENKRTLSERGKGAEGIIPLWSGVASNEQARMVKEHVTDEKAFNTYVPIPTASKDNSRYNPIKYWRGPVWIDQVYFAIEGLNRYGYKEDAINLAKKLMKNAEGINSIGKPLRENYNPENGEGLNCTNFSWSAAMIYLICKKYLLNYVD